MCTLTHGYSIKRISDVNDLTVSDGEPTVERATLAGTLAAAARHLLPLLSRRSVAAMGVSLLPLVVSVLSVLSAVGDPTASTHVDGAQPSKIGKYMRLLVKC